VLIDTSGWTEEERRMVLVGSIFAVAVMAMIFIDGYLFVRYLAGSLTLTSGRTSLFDGTRTILVFFGLSMGLPGSVLSEFANSRIKRRTFKPRNILLSLLMIGSVILVAILLLTLFDAFFSGLPILVQAPLTAVGVSVAMLMLAAQFRIKRTREFYMKAFE